MITADAETEIERSSSWWDKLINLAGLFASSCNQKQQIIVISCVGYRVQCVSGVWWDKESIAIHRMFKAPWRRVTWFDFSRWVGCHQPNVRGLRWTMASVDTLAVFGYHRYPVRNDSLRIDVTGSGTLSPMTQRCQLLASGFASASSNDVENTPVENHHDNEWYVERAHGGVDEEVWVVERTQRRSLETPVGVIHTESNRRRDCDRNHPSQCQHDVHAVRVLVLSVLYWTSHRYVPTR